MFTQGSPLGIAIIAFSMALTGIIMLFTSTTQLIGGVLLLLGVIFYGLSRYLNKYISKSKGK